MSKFLEHSETVLRGKLIVLNADIRKAEISQINNQETRKRNSKINNKQRERMK